MIENAVPDHTVLEFRDYVEWILDIDLTPTQEAEMREILDAEWAENDRETTALVEASIATFRNVMANPSEQFREEWRRDNQPAFVATLEKYASSDLGVSLLEAFRADNPYARDASSLSASEIVMGVLGMAGAVALATLSAREDAKRELQETVESDGGKSISDRLGNIMDERQREIEALRETNPQAAVLKEIEYQRMNQDLITSWMNTQTNISGAINANMSGGSWGWRPC